MDFNIKLDNELIAKGTHFWCKACVVAVPIDDQSHDTDYCHACYSIIQQAKQQGEPGRWTEGSSLYVIGNQKFGTSKTGGVVCYPVEQPATVAIMPLTTTTAIETPVSKLPDKEIIRGESEQDSFETGKHPGGRPRKTGEDISRVTAWRREKELEKQGALI
jgi:hypothetical protein